MPCTAPPRGKTDTKYPWDPDIQNDPCGAPTYSGSLCRLHWQMANGQVSGALGIDQFTVLLLHMDGADASTAFPDSSPSAHVMAAGGNAKITTAQSRFGGSSLVTVAAGDYLVTPDSPDWALGAGDFTVDFQIRFNAITDAILVADWGVPNCSWYVRYNGTQWVFAYSTTGSDTAAGLNRNFTPSLNQWYHVAFVRFGNILRVYVDGVQQGADQSFSATLLDTAASLYVPFSSNALNGWLDEVRVSKGIARWTSNFTPPSGPYS